MRVGCVQSLFNIKQVLHFRTGIRLPTPSQHCCCISSQHHGGFRRLQQENDEDGTVRVNDVKVNEVNIQMLYDNLHQQIFRDVDRPQLASGNFTKVQDHLKKHGLWKKSMEPINPVDLKLPALSGSDIDQHFSKISEDLNEPYVKLAEKFCISKIPKKPSRWVMQSGWTKYNSTGSSEPVDFPDCSLLIFDVEVLMSEGQFPTMATAVSPDAWYSWLSPRVIRKANSEPPSSDMTLDDLIPLETKPFSHDHHDKQWPPKLVIGHNVGFDRSFIKEQYYIEGSQMRFLDTMSLHITVSGMTSTQRILYAAHEKGQSGESRKEIRDMMKSGFSPSFQWTDDTSPNSLLHVHEHYCPNEPRMEKEMRNIFVKGCMDDVYYNFQELMTYCAADVKATLSVFKQVWPQFVLRFPHSVTLGGMLEMSTAYLPITSHWRHYIDAADNKYREKELELRDMLLQLAEKAREDGEVDQCKSDLWLWDQEWKIVNSMSPLSSEDVKIANMEEEAKSQANTDSTKEEKKRRYPYPTWYKDLCPRPADVNEDFPPGPSKITTLRRITPKLLKLTWEGEHACTSPTD